MKTAIWFVLALAWALPAASQDFTFKSGEYELLRDIAEEIIRPHSAGNFVVIGPGRSPAPILAYLQERHPEIPAWSVPATKLKHLWHQTEGHLTAIFEHFDHYIPVDKISPDATLVVPDHTESALGIRKVKELLEAWLKARNRSNPIESVAISYEGPVGFSHEHLVGSVDRIVTYTSPAQLTRFASERYDVFAEYGETHLWKWKEGEKYATQNSRPEYQALRNAMREKVAGRQKAYVFSVGAVWDICENALARFGIQRR